MTPPNPLRSSFTIYLPASGAKRQTLEVRQDGKTVKRFPFSSNRAFSQFAALQDASRRAQHWIDTQAPRPAQP